jgi:hypothetical protein
MLLQLQWYAAEKTILQSIPKHPTARHAGSLQATSFSYGCERPSAPPPGTPRLAVSLKLLTDSNPTACIEAASTMQRWHPNSSLTQNSAKL